MTPATVQISPLLMHDRRKGALMLCGQKVESAADLANLDRDNRNALLDYFGVGFEQICDAFELPTLH